MIIDKTKIDELHTESSKRMWKVIQQLPSPSQTNTLHVIHEIFDVLEDFRDKVLTELVYQSGMDK